jgi:hypothetical protein
MNEQHYLDTQRLILWEEAKGKLKAMLHLHYPQYQHGTGEIVQNESYDEQSKLIEQFIEDIEGCI